MVKIQVVDKPEIFFKNGEFAKGFFGRFKGLLGREELGNGDALIFPRCNSIHTVGMKFPIDILYLDRNMRVLKIIDGLQPYRFSVCLPASCVVEVKSGVCVSKGIVVNDELLFQEVNVT